MRPLYRINMTRKAISSLFEIEGFAGGAIPLPASAFAQSMVNAIDSLEDMPMRFRQVAAGTRAGTSIHVFVVEPFLIYYRIDERAKTVDVLRIIHGARRQPRRFPK